MKVAITADLHLRTKKEYPERFNALDNILTQCVELGIDLLLIAGDLFDKESASYSDFEKTCKKTPTKTYESYRFREITILEFLTAIFLWIILM